MEVGYALRVGVPTPADYLRLREESGLTPRTREQAERALPGSWTACQSSTRPARPWGWAG